MLGKINYNLESHCIVFEILPHPQAHLLSCISSSCCPPEFLLQVRRPWQCLFLYLYFHIDFCQIQNKCSVHLIDLDPHSNSGKGEADSSMTIRLKKKLRLQEVKQPSHARSLLRHFLYKLQFAYPSLVVELLSGENKEPDQNLNMSFPFISHTSNSLLGFFKLQSIKMPREEKYF